MIYLYSRKITNKFILLDFVTWVEYFRDYIMCRFIKLCKISKIFIKLLIMRLGICLFIFHNFGFLIIIFEISYRSEKYLGIYCILRWFFVVSLEIIMFWELKAILLMIKLQSILLLIVKVNKKYIQDDLYALSNYIIFILTLIYKLNYCLKIYIIDSLNIRNRIYNLKTIN